MMLTFLIDKFPFRVARCICRQSEAMARFGELYYSRGARHLSNDQQESQISERLPTLQYYMHGLYNILLKLSKLHIGILWHKCSIDGYPPPNHAICDAAVQDRSHQGRGDNLSWRRRKEVNDTFFTIYIQSFLGASDLRCSQGRQN